MRKKCRSWHRFAHQTTFFFKPNIGQRIVLVLGNVWVTKWLFLGLVVCVCVAVWSCWVVGLHNGHGQRGELGCVLVALTFPPPNPTPKLATLHSLRCVAVV